MSLLLRYASLFASSISSHDLSLLIGTPKDEAFANALFSFCVKFKLYLALISSSVENKSLFLSSVMNTRPFESIRMVMTSWSGTLIADTEPGVDTVTGSFLTKVAVNMKKVSNRTMTSDIGVMSMNVSLFLIAKRPIYIVFTFLMFLISVSPGM